MVSNIHKYNHILQKTKYGVDVGFAIDIVAPIEIYQCWDRKNVGFEDSSLVFNLFDCHWSPLECILYRVAAVVFLIVALLHQIIG